MKATISSQLIPILSIQLDPGEAVVAETGELAWMSPQLHLSTSLRKGINGIGRILSRVMGGSSAFLTTYSAIDQQGSVTFAARYPGRILPLTLTSPSTGYMIAKQSFLCGTPDVAITVGLQKKVGVALYGKEGFLLQKITGSGTAWIELGGEVIPYMLKEDEEISVHPGHVGAFETGVTPSVKLMPGISTKLFGKNGLFLVNLKGPGMIYLQSLPVARLAQSLEPYLAFAGGAAAAHVGFLDAALGLTAPPAPTRARR